MPYQVAYFQIAGQGKARNEDALFNGVDVRHVRRHKTRLVEVADETVRLAVADGVFNSPQPHLSSRFWMNAFQKYGDGYGRFLRQQHLAFCDALLPQHFGSATTFASVCMDGMGYGHICNVGDSRVYHIRTNGQWKQVSHDHTVLADMIAQGEADPNVEYSGLYSQLSDCLTADYEETSYKIFHDELTLNTGEAVLVCTDGLSDSLEHQQLEQLWQQHDTLVAKLEALRYAVQSVKLHDDCSVVCAVFLGG